MLLIKSNQQSCVTKCIVYKVGVKTTLNIKHYITTKSMCALSLVNQLWFIVPVNHVKKPASSELLFNSNKLQVSMIYLTNKEA